jgi:hypothetical protein
MLDEILGGLETVAFSSNKPALEVLLSKFDWSAFSVK